jgi:polyisoprenyl-phosphate glycosyltransferase
MMNSSEMRDNELTILMPIYNDWDALSLLLPILDRELKSDGLTAGILIVDDGSTETGPENFAARFESIKTVDVLSLRRNLGHQRAIAVGLSYIEANQPQCSVVIMDSDGEDDPKDVPRLVRECIANRGEKIVFAARIRRSEGWKFTFFYHLYRLIHFLLTGVHVRVGNFSIVPPSALKRLVAVSELWSHYAAAVHKAKLPLEVIPSQRAGRLKGPGRMDMVSLVVHGLSAMAVFGDRIGVRFLIVVSAGMVVTVTALIIVIAVRLATNLAIPGWATYATGLLLVMLIQMLLVILVFVFVILAARNAANVLPTRDYVHIMGRRQRIYG